MKMAKAGTTFNLLDPAEIRVEQDEDGVVWVRPFDGEARMVDRAVPSFPLTQSHAFVTIFDEQGEEIGVIRSLRKLDHRSRKLLEEEIERSYFMPEIQQILDVKEGLGLETWEVVTSKGERTFEVRTSRRDVRPVGRRRLLIKDVDGNRFDIPDWAQLDAPSQLLIERHI